MFSMETVGTNIMRCRKAAGMTQMALADAMGVSFQAVSNWERGQSCPDIARLSQLSELFDVSIDALLGNERAGRLATELAKEDGVPEMSLDEVRELGPLMTPEQADEAVEQSREEPDAEGVAKVALFMSQKAVNKLVSRLGKLWKLADLSKVAPFLEQDSLDTLVRSAAQAGAALGDLSQLGSFVPKSTMTELAQKAMEDGADLDELASLAPYLDKDTLAELTSKAMEDGADLDDLTSLALFLDKDTLADLARKAMEDGADLDDLTSLAPFLSRKDLTEMVARALRQGKADLGELVPLLPFLGNTELQELFRKEKDE